MMDRQIASQTRQIISRKVREREFIEKSLLKHTEMVVASLIERKLGTSIKKRSSSAYYLSGKVSGKTILKYVRKGELLQVKKKTLQWREFTNYLVRWQKINDEIGELFKELGKAQSEEPFKEELSDG